ncbi:MAG: hypothetical protein B6243_10185 [Anaerolineaceae bacterium 4572_5.2]|nr:MAG: hypothetical protein B6243_10185 [Anaerolineaceae bacterium 4572_5.2]
MNRKTAGKILLISSALLLMIFTVYHLTQSVQAQDTPPRPTPTPTAPLRPTPTQTPPLRYTPTPTPFPRGTPTPTAPHQSKSSTEESAAPGTCPVLQGHFLSVSSSFQSSPRVRLAGNEWALEEGLNANSAFIFACLGEGIAALNPVLDEGYQALTQDVALRTAHRLVTSSQDQNSAILTFTAKNATAQPLLNAWMTLLLPADLGVDNVQAKDAAVEVWQNLITIDFAPIAAGQTVAAQIAVHPVAETAAEQRWDLVASFGYSDGITRQTPSLELTTPQIAPPVFLPVTGGDGS